MKTAKLSTNEGTVWATDDDGVTTVLYKGSEEDAQVLFKAFTEIFRTLQINQEEKK